MLTSILRGMKKIFLGQMTETVYLYNSDYWANITGYTPTNKIEKFIVDRSMKDGQRGKYLRIDYDAKEITLMQAVQALMSCPEGQSILQVIVSNPINRTLDIKEQEEKSMIERIDL